MNSDLATRLLAAISAYRLPITRALAMDILKIDQKAAGILLRQMRESGQLVGRIKNGVYLYAHPQGPAAELLLGRVKSVPAQEGKVTPPRYVNVWTAPMRGYDAAIAARTAMAMRVRG
jgi:hypothetical protein